MRKLFLSLLLLTSYSVYADPVETYPTEEEQKKKKEEEEQKPQTEIADQYDYNLYDRMENKKSQQQQQQYYYYQNDAGTNSAPQYNVQQHQQHNHENRNRYFDVRNE